MTRKAVEDGDVFYFKKPMIRKAVEVINDHPADQPLFLYLAYQTAHMPMQVATDDHQWHHNHYQQHQCVLCILHLSCHLSLFRNPLQSTVSSTRDRQEFTKVVSSSLPRQSIGLLLSLWVARVMSTLRLFPFPSANAGSISHFRLKNSIWAALAYWISASMNQSMFSVHGGVVALPWYT